MELPPDESAEDATDQDEPEKIEVHVHLHRGEKRARTKRPPPPLMTGILFDWQWYKDRLLSRPRPKAPSRWSFAWTCQACDSVAPAAAQNCPRCGAPRTRRRHFRAIAALVGLATIGILFVLGARVLGDSVPEQHAPGPLGRWSDDDFVIVEVPAAAPSPFSAPIGNGVASGSSGPAIR